MAPKINNPFTAKSYPINLAPGDTVSLRASPIAQPTFPLSYFKPTEQDESQKPSEVQTLPAPDANDVALQAEEILALPDVPLSTSKAPLANETYESDIQRLVSITEGSRDVLMSVNAVLPIQPSPNSICVDRQKLTIVHRTFFGSSDTISVQMDDIHNVEAFVGPFFGEIRIFSKYFVNNVQSLPGLKRSDAIAIRRLIQGYMIAHHKGIDCSRIEKDRLVELLTELGKGNR